MESGGLDVSAFDVRIGSVANGLGAPFGHHVDRTATAENSVARSEPLSDAARRQRLSQKENDLTPLAQPFVLLRADSRSLLPVAHRTDSRSRGFRDRCLGEAVVAKPQHDLASLDRSIETLDGMCG